MPMAWSLTSNPASFIWCFARGRTSATRASTFQPYPGILEVPRAAGLPSPRINPLGLPDRSLVSTHRIAARHKGRGDHLRPGGVQRVGRCSRRGQLSGGDPGDLREPAVGISGLRMHSRPFPRADKPPRSQRRGSPRRRSACRLLIAWRCSGLQTAFRSGSVASHRLSRSDRWARAGQRDLQPRRVPQAAPTRSSD
jgi:hypothetical protein